MANKKLSGWLVKNYWSLRRKFKDKEFYLEDAAESLKEKRIEKSSINVILSDLRKADLIETRPDEKDARKTVYKLKPIQQLLKVNGKMTKDELIGLLKRAADIIRTRVSYEFILVLLFLKRISDKWEIEYEQAYKEALKAGLNEKEAKEEAKASVYHEFDLPEEFLWDNVRKEVSRLPEKLAQTMKVISERNPELKDVFERADFMQFASSSENAEILRQLFEIFSERKLYHVSPDILGDAYEWILSYFAPQKAKEGELYTPREAIKLMVEILGPKPTETVYDPSCGSGGMLIISYNHVKEKFGEKKARKLFLYGQEVNPTTLAICKMNLFIHDIRDSDIVLGDTLLYPKFKKSGGTKQFDIVIFNPPWNQDGYGEEVLKKGEFWKKRFEYGFSTNQSADWVWIQHSLTSAKENGRIGIVIDNGCLFRGGKERSIRAKILDKKQDLIECVILLPGKLFYNTGAPGAIIIFNKNKSKGRRGKVLFINASEEYEQHPNVRRLNILGDKNIEKIVKVYKNFKNVKGFTRIVSLDEIKENDYNLNVTLYVFPEEETDDIDVKKEWKDLKKIEVEIGKVKKNIEGFLKVVG